MPTVLRQDGFRVMIYPHDHEPAHVHVYKGDGVAVINLAPVTVRDFVNLGKMNCDEPCESSKLIKSNCWSDGGRFMPLSDADFERQFAEAKKRGDERYRTEPLAIAVRFDKRSRRVVVELNKGTTLSVPVDLLQGLQDASVKELSRVEILGPGFDIEWPTLDQQFSVTGLLSGVFGTKAWMAELARRSGRLKSKVVRTGTKSRRRKRAIVASPR